MFFFFFFFAHFYFPASSGQAVITGVVPSPPRFLPSIFFAHRVQQLHCSSIFHRVLLTHALALSASQFVHKKKSQRIYIRVCTRRGSNSRNWPIPGSRITWYATGATGYSDTHRCVLSTISFIAVTPSGPTPTGISHGLGSGLGLVSWLWKTQ